jgi:DNA-binding transcriptional MerR regulator
MAPKRASSKASPSVDEAAKAALLAEKKGKALVDTTHQEACKDDALSKRQHNEQLTPEGSLRTCSSGGQPQPPLGFAVPEGADATEDGEVISVSAEEQLHLRALRIKNRNLQKQKEILEAKRQRVSAQAKVRQMIRDEEQKAQELEQEIALMQREGQLGPPLQQHTQIEDLSIPQHGHAIPHAAAFQGVNYLDEWSPLTPHLQVSPWPTNFRVGTYPKYNGSTDPA